MSQATDVNVLHELKDALDDVAVYTWAEVEQFVERYFQNIDAQELSPLIDIAAARFNTDLGLDDPDKADFKIKAKQFVKIYGQMAAILPFEVVKWEKLFWFLKFLIPKLIITDTAADAIDALLNSVDLASYGLERVKLNVAIKLDDVESVLDPQNPNPRAAHDNDEDEDPLDLIIRSFNERWFQGWDATPDEQRIKFVKWANDIRNHKDYASKFANNPDSQNSDIAFDKIFNEIMRKHFYEAHDLYRKMQEEGFKQAMQDTLKRILGDESVLRAANLQIYIK